MLDLFPLREGFEKDQISNILFVRSVENVADALTKEMTKAFLLIIIKYGALNLKIEQWIITRESSLSHYCCGAPYQEGNSS